MRSLKKKLRVISAGLMFVSLTVMTAGCGKEKEQVETTPTPAVISQNIGTESTDSNRQAVESGELQFDSNVIKVGAEQVTYREILIYLLQIKNKYEPNVGSEIWNKKISQNQTFGEQAKQEMLDQIAKIKIIKQQAEELKVSLTNDEENEVASSVRTYMTGITKEDQQRYGITEEMVQKVLEENYLAQKMYNIATNEVNTDISDDEAKQIKVQMLEVMTNGTDKDGNKIESDENQKKQAKERAEELRKQAVSQADFGSFATANTDASEVDVTFGKGQYKQLDEVAFSLKQGEISNVITTDSGYVILKLISAFDKEATNLKKEAIIEEERDKVFAEKYKVWSGEYKVTQDTTKWNLISFHI